MSKIKICGLTREIDAEYINEAKPDFAGFVIGVEWSSRNINITQAEILRKRIDNSIPAVGVFIDYPAKKVAQLANTGIIDIVQLHGSESDDYILKLRSLSPNTEIWKAFVIKSAADIETAEKSSADRVLLDSGAGCGKTFDWSAVNRINREFILAGGLNSKNIPEAISQVHPWAVDLSSGVETDKIKDRNKILEAVAAARFNN